MKYSPAFYRFLPAGFRLRRNATARGMSQAWNILRLAPLLLTTGLSGCSLISPLIGAALPFALIKLHFACLPAHTNIDTPAGPRPVEELEPGDMVIGFAGKPVRILQKHSYLENTNTIFLHMIFDSGAAVDLCGMHRIAGIRARDIHPGQMIAGHKVASVDSRCGVTHSYDLLTEDAGYQIQGIAVNSMIEEMNSAAAHGRMPSPH